MPSQDDRIFSDQERRLFDRLQDVIDKTVREVCTRQIPANAEEPVITSRVAQAIETELQHHRLEVGDMKVSVDTHDIQSRGPGALEKRSGVDLYISIARNDGAGSVSKGILIQSKHRRAMRPKNNDLRNQAGRMIRRSPESYVAVFGENNAVAVPAQRAAYPRLPDDFFRDQMSLGKLISDGFRCRRGSTQIGIDLDAPRTDAIEAVMKRLRARRGLSFLVSRAPPTGRGR